MQVVAYGWCVGGVSYIGGGMCVVCGWCVLYRWWHVGGVQGGMWAWAGAAPRSVQVVLCSLPYLGDHQLVGRHTLDPKPSPG